jgi:hypothetical protein
MPTFYENQWFITVFTRDRVLVLALSHINLLAPEFDIQIVAHPVCKMLIIQEPKKLALQNTQHFEEKRRRHCTVFKKI